MNRGHGLLFGRQNRELRIELLDQRRAHHAGLQAELAALRNESAGPKPIGQPPHHAPIHTIGDGENLIRAGAAH